MDELGETQIIPNPREFIQQEELTLQKVVGLINQALSEGKTEEARNFAFWWIQRSYLIIREFKAVLDEMDNTNPELQSLKDDIERLNQSATKQPEPVPDEIKTLLTSPRYQIKSGPLPFTQAIRELRKLAKAPVIGEQPSKPVKKGFLGGLIK